MSAHRRIGKYEIWDELARGGMGVVYRGFQPSLGRVVAIKALLPGFEGDSDFLGRFRIEAGAIALLNHANIVRIHDIQSEGETTFIIMEFVAGPSLRRVLRGAGRLDPGRAADLVVQAARGLGVAHRQGIVHRDIKPENLLLTAHGLLKVMDFGVAKLASSDLKTRTGTALGTPAYMSPEQARGEKVDPRSDLYALTTVLFELVTGELLFSGPDPFSIALRHVRDPPPDPSGLRPDLPPGFADLILHGLRKKREERFQTAGEMAAAFEPYAEAARSNRARARSHATLDRCPSCREPTRADFSACPACGTSLLTPCDRCRQDFRLGLATCPFCWAPAGSFVPPVDASEETRQLPTPVTPAPPADRDTAEEIMGIRRRLLDRARGLPSGATGVTHRTPPPLAGSPTLRPPDPPPPPPLPEAAVRPPPVAAPRSPASTCPTCDGAVDPDFVRCPFCGRPLR